MKKKLVFKKGIRMIIFPCMLPFGKIDFNEQAEKEIAKTKDKYQPRKKVTWNYTMDWENQMAEVIVFKI